MKKISTLLIGLALSGTVFAQALPPASGAGTIGLSTGDCPLLNENVRINLSGSVSGALHCNPDRIAISACHINGRQVSRLVDVRTPAGCGTPETPCTGTERATRTGAAVPTASTMRFRFVQQMSQKDAESTMPNRATTMPFGTVSTFITGPPSFCQKYSSGSGFSAPNIFRGAPAPRPRPAS